MRPLMRPCLSRFLSLFLFLCLVLSGCLDVSHPFADAGPEARYLTQKNLPPPRLAVPVPVPANAPWRAATGLWARDVVVALLGQSVPAVAQRPRPGDWWVRLGAVRDPAGIKPRYAIVDPAGKVRAVGYGAVMDRKGWLDADPAALNTVALQIAPEIAQMLTGIQAQMMQDNPQSLVNRPAHIYFEGVKGAPGDGNLMLGRAFYMFLPDGRNQLQRTLKGADYIVNTEVHVKDVPLGQAVKVNAGGRPKVKHEAHVVTQEILIIWHVRTAGGQEAGAATQLHDIPAHSLDGAWGDVANIAAQEAAGAVRTIVTNYSGREHKPLSKAMRKTTVESEHDDEATRYIDGPAELQKP